MPNPRRLARTEYDAAAQVLTLEYENGHRVRVRGVTAERAARLMERASAEAKRSASGDDFSNFTR